LCHYFHDFVVKYSSFTHHCYSTICKNSNILVYHKNNFNLRLPRICRHFESHYINQTRMHAALISGHHVHDPKLLTASLSLQLSCHFPIVLRDAHLQHHSPGLNIRSLKCLPSLQRSHTYTFATKTKGHFGPYIKPHQYKLLKAVTTSH
jgi:hypothetical protein